MFAEGNMKLTEKKKKRNLNEIKSSGAKKLRES